MRALALNMAAILAVISDNIQRVTGQDNSVRNNSCTLRSSQENHCDFCIQSAQCAWCADADPKWTGPRCDKRAWYVQGVPFYFLIF